MEGASCHLYRFLQPENTLIALAVIVSMTTTQGTAGQTRNVVGTDPLVKLENGTVGFLPCRVSIQPTGVLWSSGPSFDESRLIMSYEPSFINDERAGPGYDDGTYNMTGDFSLVINEVTFENENDYFCEAADLTGNIFHNKSSVLVYVLPEDPFPSIENCLNDTDAVRKGQNCSIYRSQLSHNITCSVWGYTPDIVVSIYINKASQRLEVVDVSEFPDGDRTVGRSVTVMGSVSFEPYECRASYVTIKGELVEKSATITLRYRPEQSSEGLHRAKEIPIILTLFFFSCVIPLMFVYVVALRRVEEVLQKRPWIQIVHGLNKSISTSKSGFFKFCLFSLRSTFYYSCYYCYYYYDTAESTRKYFIHDNSDLRRKKDFETITLFLLFAVSYSVLGMGVLFEQDCPLEDNNAIFLIVMGSMSILLCVIYLTLRYLWLSRLTVMWTSWHFNFWKSLTGMLVIAVVFILCAMYIFFCTKSLWANRNVWHNRSDPTSPEYCHPTLYTFSVGLTILLILLININGTMIIFAIIRSTCTSVCTYQYPKRGTQLFIIRDGVLQQEGGP